MAKPETILEWLKEAGAYAFACEDPERPGGWLSVELLINGGTVACACDAANARHTIA